MRDGDGSEGSGDRSVEVNYLSASRRRRRRRSVGCAASCASYSCKRAPDAQPLASCFSEKSFSPQRCHWADHIALLRPLWLQGRQFLFRFCVVPKLGHLPRTLRSDEPPMMAIWERADSYAPAEMQCYAASPVSGFLKLGFA